MRERTREIEKKNERDRKRERERERLRERERYRARFLLIGSNVCCIDTARNAKLIL